MPFRRQGFGMGIVSRNKLIIKQSPQALWLLISIFRWVERSASFKCLHLDVVKTLYLTYEWLSATGFSFTSGAVICNRVTIEFGWCKAMQISDRGKVHKLKKFWGLILKTFLCQSPVAKSWVWSLSSWRPFCRFHKIIDKNYFSSYQNESE